MPSLTLPTEIWEIILDCLDSKELLNFQHTCHAWRQIVLSYIINGRLKNRALVSYTKINLITFCRNFGLLSEGL